MKLSGWIVVAGVVAVAGCSSSEVTAPITPAELCARGDSLLL